MKRIIIAAVVLLCTACTPAEIAWWTAATQPERDAVVEHIVREAAARWEVDGDLLVRIVRCESGMRPDAVNRTSGALGLGQHLPRYWPARAEALGWEPSQWAEPYVNADVTAWMLATQGVRPWEPSRYCWTRG